MPFVYIGLGTLQAPKLNEFERGIGAELDPGVDVFELHDLFPFEPAERDLLGRLSTVLRRAMPSLPTCDIRGAALAVTAIEQFPRSTPNVAVTLSFEGTGDCRGYYMSIYVSEDQFALSSGHSDCSPEAGHDHSSETCFDVRLGGSRAGSTYRFEHWLDSLADARGRWAVEDAGDDMTGAIDVEPDAGWDVLAEVRSDKTKPG